jgi:type IV pilus assembly protein PilA
MKPEVTLKYLSYLRNKKQNGEEGFTLIELLVVVIIIGVLAAVALPSLLSQVGKARETEFKNAVGTVNRAQQSYHFERQTFANSTSNLGITVPTQYIDSPEAFNGVTSLVAEYRPANSDYGKDGTRAYSGAIGFTTASSTYTQAVCQTTDVTASTTAPTNSTTCPSGSVIVR